MKIEITFDEAYQFIKLYDILRDMDMPLTSKQMSVFEKIQDQQVNYSTKVEKAQSKQPTMEW
tara:strand:- start:504 stop:689 length:186 start_codon:yes stop_codon:yes gene_type:complete